MAGGTARGGMCVFGAGEEVRLISCGNGVCSGAGGEKGCAL